MKMKIKDKNWNCLKKMPPLYHTRPFEKYDSSKSEVVQWIIQHPDLVAWIVGKAKYDGLIVYDETTKKYRGSDYEN